MYGLYDTNEIIFGHFFELANEINGDVIVITLLWGSTIYNKTSIIVPSSSFGVGKENNSDLHICNEF